MIDNNTSPVVSICIPVFNCEKYIQHAVASVINQTYLNFELLILDNASTDKTREKITNFADQRIRYLRNSRNLGMRGNWNLALDEARGKYIKILPADDFLYNNCLERQINAFENNIDKNIALCCCGRDIINQQGKRLLSRSFARVNGIVSGTEAIRRIVRSGTNLLGEPGAILFKKKLLRNLGGFSDRYPYVIDLELWIKLLSLGNLYVIKDNLCAFRISPNSESVTGRKSQSRDFINYINSLNRDCYKLSRFDILTGKGSSTVLEIMRRLVYRLSNKRENNG